MSLSALPVPVAKVFDPRVDVLKEREYVITKSGNKISYVPYRSMSTGSSALAFNVIPPSRTTFIDRKMYISTSVSITFVATLNANPAGGFWPLLNNEIVSAGSDAPRSFPLSRALATATCTIGNTNVSQQTADVIDALLRVMKVEELKDYNDGCPTALDRSQTFEAYADNANSGLNVLANYTDALLDNGEYARGFFDVTVSAPDVSVAGIVKQVVSFKVYEPVMLSPFVWSKMNHSGLIGLQNITLQYNFAQNLAQLVWSGSKLVDTQATPAAVPVAVDVAFCPLNADNSVSNQTDAQLWVSYISPSALMEIPKEVSYNYYEVQRFLSNGFSSLKYGETTTIQSNNIQLKVIPSLLFCGVRRTKANQKYYNPDCYYRITGAAINFANTVGLLSTASDFNLYEISKKNGLNYNYREWKGKYGNLNSDGAVTPAAPAATLPSGTGGLLVLKPSEDFGLQDGEAAGLSGAFNLQVQLSIECIDPSLAAAGSNDYELFVIVVNEGQMSIDVAGTGSVVTNIGVVSEADVLKAEVKPYLDYNAMAGLVGGDFLNTLKNWGKKAASVVHTVADLAPKASNALKSVGMGQGGELVGSGRGGKLLGKKSLKDRLM